MNDILLALKWTAQDYVAYVLIFFLGVVCGAMGIILSIGPRDHGDR